MQAETAIKIQVKPWGKHGGKDVYLFRITNAYGNYVELTNYGATLVNVVVPDKNGDTGSVILGYDDLQAYLNDTYYIGSTIGRFANRIGNASFTIDGKDYYLDKNDGENSNHGGFAGYHQRVFDFELSDDTIRMTLLDEDGTGGYPGTLKLKVTFTWNDDNELYIGYEAETDKPTIANFTNHAYFNLSGTDNLVTNQRLSISAGSYLESDENYLPTGKIFIDTDGFINGRLLGDILDSSRPIETGLNRYFTLLDQNAEKAQAELYDPATGRELKVFTSYPGIMVYTAQYLDTEGRGGQAYKPFSAVCLECQHYPDGINHQYFPSAILRPDGQYNQFIKFRFNVR
ncbi:galactose mutarotase [Mucilaginibacter conchicola]|uniref:Aldose 1-epimerase n=1 Tax=Mucilaginibacter conchicola TaxID=2303333 RepID=A0A372P0A6_9SPHI|nr:aldose epimerase family protein [Mucilaginibacter conchicola]RFZ95805.1 galactose mutarotase [Mucilaginibacter conchicola]